MYIFEVMTFFLAEWLINQQNFSVAVRVYKIHVFDASGHQTRQGGDKPRGASTDKFLWHINGMVLVIKALCKMYYVKIDN